MGRTQRLMRPLRLATRSRRRGFDKNHIPTLDMISEEDERRTLRDETAKTPLALDQRQLEGPDP